MMLTLGRSLGLAILFATTSFASAAVKVEESRSVEQRNQEQQHAVLMQLYNQFQMMQEEIMQLRGMVEEHEYQLQQLKQQQRDDYQQLDQRLQELVKSGSSPTASIDDAQAYQQISALIEARKFKEALLEFEGFVQTYPDSSLLANAHYWLGELYSIEGNVAKSRENFEAIIKRFKQGVDDNKYPDALYSLARIDIQQNSKSAARDKLDALLNYLEGKPSYANVRDKALALKNKHFP